MNIKKAMLIFPSNVLICYDIYIVDWLNRYKNQLRKPVYEHAVELLMSCYNGTIVDTPLHKLENKYGRLKIVDILTGLESGYTSLNKLIYGKSRFITINVYDYLIREGYRDLLGIGDIKHKNMTCNNLMEQYNNFIVYDNRNWNERDLVRAVYGGTEEQYIDRDKLMEWLDKNINPAEDNGLELTIVSDAFDIDKELAVEAFHKLGMEKSRFIQTELRICCINSENLRRYNETVKGKNFYRSSVGLYKLWDQASLR